MFTALIIVHVIVSLILIVVVLFQTGKGASMGAVFGGASSQTLFGSAGPATFLGKITAGCAVIFMITSMSLTYLTAAKKTSSIMKDIPKQETTEQVQPEETAIPEKAEEAKVQEKTEKNMFKQEKQEKKTEESIPKQEKQ